MKGFRGVLAVAGLIAAGAALAGESLINGEPLQYNHDYRCNGERIVIGRCRDKADTSDCQVYYPDRPLHNGLMVQPIERRGDIIRRLAQCAAPAQVAATLRRTVPAPGAEGGVPLIAPPGLGRATWKMFEWDDESATFFTDAGMRRTPKAKRGWFTTIYAKPRTLKNGAQYIFEQDYYAADCAGGSYNLVQLDLYDGNAKLIRAYAMDPLKTMISAPGSFGAAQLNILCGRRQELNGGDDPIVTDVNGLKDFYALLVMQGNGKKIGKVPLK